MPFVSYCHRIVFTFLVFLVLGFLFSPRFCSSIFECRCLPLPRDAYEKNIINNDDTADPHFIPQHLAKFW